MKAGSLVLAIASYGAALAQNGYLMNGSADWNGITLAFETVLYPSTPPMAEGFVGGNITDSSAIHRYLFYNSQQTYFGYDLFVEPVPKTEFYKVTFRPLSVADPKRLEISHPESWKMVPLSGYPAPQTVHAGDTVELELFKNPATGQKIIEYVRVLGQKGRGNPYVIGTGDVLFVNLIHQPDASGTFVVRPDGTIPLVRYWGPIKAAGRTVDELTAALEDQFSRYFNHPKVNVRVMRIDSKNAPGVARDISVDDVELRIIAPQVSLNGNHLYPATYEDGVSGPAVWFYLPDHGRYLLSLVAHPQLGFVKSGEVRGSTLTFSIDGETLSLSSGVDIAPGFAPYNLYVLHEPAWRPREDALGGTFLMGSSERAEEVVQSGNSKPHEIGPEDVLFVSILHHPDVSGTATVRADGFISVRLAGEVKAAGLTPKQLSDAIAERLAKQFNYPEVSVQIVRVNSLKIYLSGQIHKPGAYPLAKPKTVLEAIIEAGGPVEFAKTTKIYVLRGQQKLPFNYRDVSRGLHLEQNVILQNGDVIVVP